MDEFILSPSYKLDLYDLWKQVGGIAEDFTLLDLVRIVRAAETDHPGLAAAFGMPCIDAFYEEVTRERDPDDEDNLHHLELYWTFDHDVETITKARKWNRRRPKGKRRITDVQEVPDRGGMPNLMSFHGIGEHWTDGNIKCADWEHCDHHRQYAIWLTSLNNLAHLPIRMDIAARVYRPMLHEMLRPTRRFLRWLGRLGRPLLERWDKRLAIPIMTIEIRPTLHAFISSVLWELTFSGPHPDDREAKSKELERSCEEAKGASERGELIDMDDMLDELDERREDDDTA